MIYQVAETVIISLLVVLLLPLAASVVIHEMDLLITPPTITEQHTGVRKWAPDYHRNDTYRVSGVNAKKERTQ